MFIATVPNRNSPPCILLRESYRENGKSKTRTLKNITHWAPERIEALRRTLKGEFDQVQHSAQPTSGLIFGVLFVLSNIARQLGLSQALGKNRMASLALFLVLARIAHRGSRLSAVQWARDHAVFENLQLDSFDEDDLYAALDWLDLQQEKIELKLYKRFLKRAEAPPVLVLYDVTSSYLEGELNELAAFGYNRDGKKGKLQIVIGLLTASDGTPLAIRVFDGNTADPSTVNRQIAILKQRFGIDEVVFVGDRGMVKTRGKLALHEAGFKYISALTNAQVRRLMKEQVIQPGLFDTQIQEVEHDGKRLVLRLNAEIRRKQAHRREDKLARLQEKIKERNEFVLQSKRADPEAGLRQLTDWSKRHKLNKFVELTLEGREIQFRLDEEARSEATLLDGCYVLETDVDKEKLDRNSVDACYRSLQKVERDFRTLKTGFLEIRPIFVRKAGRTRGHVFAAMLALLIVREANARLQAKFGPTTEGAESVTLEEALTAMSRLSFNIYPTKGEPIQRLAKPDERQRAILEALGIRRPRRTSYPSHSAPPKKCRQ